MVNVEDSGVSGNLSEVGSEGSAGINIGGHNNWKRVLAYLIL